MKRPNIVMITCHDLGDFLPCYGTPAPAPHFARLAAEGVVFQNHFSTGTVCSPSRGSIVTGCYPHTNGLMGLVHRGWSVDVDHFVTLPRMLRDLGYETHLFGIQHEHWDSSKLGYMEDHATPGRFCDQVTPVFTEWLRSQRPEGAFFASIGYFDPHRIDLKPSHFKRDAYTRADPDDVMVPPWLPDIPQVRQDLADFYGAVGLIDEMVGEIMTALKEEGLEEDTLLIFTVDHGASFTHGKATLYDGGTKVALMMRWPGELPESHVVESFSSHVDILPTLCSLLDLPIPEQVQGLDLARTARAEDDAPTRAAAYAEKNYTNYYDPSRMVRTQEFKYIRKGLRTCIYDFQIPEIELSSWGFRQHREVFQFYSAERCTEELYDLALDPGEMHNVANDPAYAEALNAMRAALDAHLAETNDPFADLNNGLLMPVDDYVVLQKRKLGRV